MRKIPPTVEECKVCSDNYTKQIEQLNGGIKTLHYAINKMMKEYTKLHMEERALEEIEDLCLNDNILEVKEDILEVNDSLTLILGRIKKICKNIKEQRNEIEKEIE